MTRTLRMLALTFLAAVTGTCREVPQAPTEAPATPLPYLTLTLDTLHGFQLDVANQWSGVTLLRGSDLSLHVISLDNWNGRLRYHGCANFCDDRVHWFSGTADSGLYQYGISLAGAALTPAGFQVVYTRYFATGYYGPAIRFVQCAADCNMPGAWLAGDLFADYGSIEGYGHGSPLAVDPAGGSHLVFYDIARYALYYAQCAAACTDSTNWQRVRLDSAGVGDRNARLIAVDPAGGVHVLYSRGSSLVQASCDAGCTNAAAWQSSLIPGVTTVNGLQGASLAFGSGGRVDVALVDWAGNTGFATCTGNCSVGTAWSGAALPLSTSDVSLARDSLGVLYLATIDSAVVVSRCAAGCLDPAAWKPTALTTAIGGGSGPFGFGGSVSIGVDSNGTVRVASADGGWPMMVQYTQMPR